MTNEKIYKIELATSEDFEIMHANSDEEIIKEANTINGGYLNIFELDDNYEELRQVI